MFYEALKLVGGTAIHVDRQNNLSGKYGNKIEKNEGPPEI